MRRFLRRTKSLPHRNKRSRIGVVAINITQQRTQLLPRRRIQAPMLLQTVLRPSLQLVEVPPSLRHANHRNIEGATLDHRLQRRKNLLIRKIASRTEEHQRIGMKLTHAFSPSKQQSTYQPASRVDRQTHSASQTEVYSRSQPHREN